MTARGRRLGMQASQAEAISAPLQRGMTLPFVVAMVGPNSSVFCLRYDKSQVGGALEATALADMVIPGDFESPINMMVVDQSGEAVRVIMTREGLTYY